MSRCRPSRANFPPRPIRRSGSSTAFNSPSSSRLLPLAALGEMIGYRRVFLGGDHPLHHRLARLRARPEPAGADLHARRAGIGLGGHHERQWRAVAFFLSAALARARRRHECAGRLGRRGVRPDRRFRRSWRSGPWQWLFAVNVPIGIFAILVGRVTLPASPTSGRLDLPSTLLNVATFGLGFIGVDVLTRGGDARIGAAELAVAVVTGLALIWRSRSQAKAAGADRSAQKPAVRADGGDVDRLLRRANAGLRLLALLSPGRAASQPGRHRPVDDALAVRRRRRRDRSPAAAADRFPAAILGGAGLAVLAARAGVAGDPADRRLRAVDRLADGGLRPRASASSRRRTIAPCCPRRRWTAAARRAACSRPRG